MLPKDLHEPPNLVKDAVAAIEEHEVDEEFNESFGLCFLAAEDVNEHFKVNFVVCHILTLTVF